MDGLVIGARTPKVVALNLLAADLAQEFELFLCLHALCERPVADALVHRDDRDDDVARPLRVALEEGHVHLQDIEALILEELEARVPAAEIVHPDLIAGCTEAVEHLANLLVAVSQDVLDDLEVQEIARHIVLAHGVLDDLEDIAVDEIQTREVQRDRY